MKKSDRLIAEETFVERELGNLPSICITCSCTLHNYATKCSAALSDLCHGFTAIEQARERFGKELAARYNVEKPSKTLSQAVREARGGDAPKKIKGFA